MVDDGGEMRYVGVGRETSFGNPATPVRYLDPLSVSIAADKEPILRRGIGVRWPVDKAPGNVVVSGDVEFPANPARSNRCSKRLQPHLQALRGRGGSANLHHRNRLGLDC